jgi:Kef-type K+ transport system membrane component KefB
MAAIELTIALLLAAALLARLARWLSAPYPLLLALAGTATAFGPGAPEASLHPALALALFVAPTLLDAAYDASPRDLRDNCASVLGLALFAVGVTVAAVAMVARALAPEMPRAAAVALGAIVAPPDASAAAAILRQLRRPHTHAPRRGRRDPRRPRRPELAGGGRPHGPRRRGQRNGRGAERPAGGRGRADTEAPAADRMAALLREVP